MRARSAKTRQPRSFVDAHHTSGYRRYGMSCRFVGSFAHYTLHRQAAETARRVKLARGHAYQFQSQLYAATLRFIDDHRTRSAADHPWCRAPERRIAANVTLFTNELLEYCGLPRVRLGEVRAA